MGWGMTEARSPRKAARPWWETRWAVAGLMLAAALPLLWPDIPPLVDLPGHMGRYKIELDLAASPDLQRYYRFDWAMIGNLGIDLLIVPLAPLLGLELATKLIVLAIPPLTVAGFLWVAREIHGRIPPNALFAVPFAYAYPFLFGFVNYALSMALALLAFALWLRWGRLERWRLRAALFVPISVALWLCHAFGWAVLGVLVFSAELVRQRDSGRAFVPAIAFAALGCLPLALPVVLTLAWRQGVGSGDTGDWFNWRAKSAWLIMVLRDRWYWFDLLSAAAMILVVFGTWRSPRFALSRALGLGVGFLLLIFILLPRILLGSAYADMRLIPYVVALGLIAARPRGDAPPHLAPRLAAVALLFVLLRIGANVWSFGLYDRTYDRELAAIDHIPRGARLASFVGAPCTDEWRMSRLFHLPSIALVRREAFANDQWSMAGAQLVRIVYPVSSDYGGDPSQIVVASGCEGTPFRSLDESLRYLPRAAFDYVWLIDPPAYDARLAEGMVPVWRSGSSVLYRVSNRARPAS